MKSRVRGRQSSNGRDRFTNGRWPAQVERGARCCVDVQGLHCVLVLMGCFIVSIKEGLMFKHIYGKLWFWYGKKEQF